MIKLNVMGVKNLDLKDLIFLQLRYFQQLARNVLILIKKRGLKITCQIKLKPGVENEYGL